MARDGKRDDGGHSRSRLLERAFHGAMDGVAVLDDDEEYVLVNESHADLYGYDDPDAMVDETWEVCYEGSELERFRETVMPTLYEEGVWCGNAEGVRADGTTFKQELSLTTLDEWGLVCVVRDISDRVARKQELEATNSLLSTLVENIPVGILAEDANREVLFTNALFCSLFDIEGPPSDLVGTDCKAAAHQFKHLFVDSERFIERTDFAVTASTPIEQEEFDLVDGRTIERSAIPVALDGEKTGFLWVYRDVTRRTQYQRRFNALHETTRELMLTSSEEEIASIVSSAVTDILELPLNGFHLYDEAVDGLVPVAWSEEADSIMGTPPTFTAGDGLAWQTFQRGDPTVFTNVQTSDAVYNPDTPIRSEIHLPLGDHGILLVGETRGQTFDETDITLAKLFATTVETALDRAADERERKRQERELRQRNDQLKQFANVLSHDLRNPLNVASGRLELLDVDRNNEHVEAIRRSHDRMEALIQDTLLLARQGQPIGEMTSVSLERTALNAWSQVDTAGASIEVDRDAKLMADEGRLQQLFENLFHNSVEHGGTDVTVHVGGLDDGSGFYVADDGAGIPPAERERVFDYGYTTSTEGTGFGLAIVQQIVQAHDWEISVAESTAGGARFEVRDIEADRLQWV